jgi:hypothetical protein
MEICSEKEIPQYILHHSAWRREEQAHVLYDQMGNKKKRCTHGHEELTQVQFNHPHQGSALPALYSKPSVL